MLKVILFDWGDTLMEELPGATGKMADWPAVKAIPGAKAALSTLEHRYALGVATNARDSDQLDVKRALERVGLARYFQYVFTYRDLKISKVDPFYYSTLVDLLNQSAPFAAGHLESGEVMMVGDDYHADIACAKKAGLRSVWLNPTISTVPDLPPIQDGELEQLGQVTGLLEQELLPDIDRCMTWLTEQDLPHNIIDHSKTVANVAYLMASWLRQSGEMINPLLAHRGGLLHDLDKLSARQHQEEHGDYSARLLSEKGQPVLAEIARRHVISTILTDGSGPRTWEEKLVYFADKLVEKTTIGPLSVRLGALVQRYPDYASSTLACQPWIEALQKDICQRLDTNPDRLMRRLILENHPLKG